VSHPWHSPLACGQDLAICGYFAPCLHNTVPITLTPLKLPTSPCSRMPNLVRASTDYGQTAHCPNCLHCFAPRLDEVQHMQNSIAVSKRWFLGSTKGAEKGPKIFLRVFSRDLHGTSQILTASEVSTEGGESSPTVVKKISCGGARAVGEESTPDQQRALARLQRHSQKSSQLQVTACMPPIQFNIRSP